MVYKIATTITMQQEGVCHTLALLFKFLKYLKATPPSPKKKHYGNSNISSCKNKKNHKKNRLKETKNLQHYNTSPNIIFQKSSYQNK
jgi:hypothetical protein